MHCDKLIYMTLGLCSVFGFVIVSGSAINHLANAEHLKNLKHFLWKYGGGMDSIDTFRISENELAKVYIYAFSFSHH